MSNVAAGAQAHANKSPPKKSSDADDLREGVSDLGSSVGDMATRQYQRAQDMATDALDDTSDAVGALIKADCSINWRDPDSGKLYCFSTGTSLVYFQNWPKA